jgi:hypothetical protein
MKKGGGNRRTSDDPSKPDMKRTFLVDCFVPIVLQKSKIAG